MSLRCQSIGAKCPPYKHRGIFKANNENVKPLLPDLNRCATCMAYTPPKRLDLREDLFQVASITLIEKGPAFDPTHQSNASFGTFIRPRICGALMDVKSKESLYSQREEHISQVHPNDDWLYQIPDPNANFEDELLAEITIATILPEILKALTPREQEIFDCIRNNQKNSEIIETLKLSKSRVSQLRTQVTGKVIAECKKLGLIE